MIVLCTRSPVYLPSVDQQKSKMAPPKLFYPNPDHSREAHFYNNIMIQFESHYNLYYELQRQPAISARRCYPFAWISLSASVSSAVIDSHNARSHILRAYHILAVSKFHSWNTYAIPGELHLKKPTTTIRPLWSIQYVLQIYLYKYAEVKRTGKSLSTGA